MNKPFVYEIDLMSSLRFTALVGGDSPCNMIEVLGPDNSSDPIVLLLDCGWEEPFRVDALDPIIR